MEETNRQRKIAGVLQKDLVDVLQKAAQDGMQGVIISVSKVSVTPDLGVAKVYLSVFPFVIGHYIVITIWKDFIFHTSMKA